MNPELGGVASSVECLHEEILNHHGRSEVHDTREKAQNSSMNGKELVIAHGLWQWPGKVALEKYRKYGNPYIVFPHGMLDPWFKKAYPFKHLKKQAYWWYVQGSILKNARAVCFTTEEERALASKTFWPYRCKEVVTGLGVGDPPEDSVDQKEKFLERFPALRKKRMLLYLGRFHPKKGVDLLLNAWRACLGSNDDCALVLGGPLDEGSAFLEKLRNQSSEAGGIHWTGMLDGSMKWGALRAAEALILPSHQENYGMVVAEACAVGTPVLMTNKVNLWREITEFGAGVVAADDAAGISSLLREWNFGLKPEMGQAAQACFNKRLHARNAALRIMELAD